MADSEYLLLELAQSRQHQFALVLLHVLAYSAVLISDVPLPARESVFLILLLISLLYYLSCARAMVRMILAPDGECTFLNRHNRELSTMSLVNSYCGPLTILRLRDISTGAKRYQLIYADALGSSELKKLKSLLKVLGR